MRKVNHSKYKNTGFLFEILTRQVTVDTIEGVTETKALDMLKKYFSKETELYKEYALYDAVMNGGKFVSETRAQTFIDKVLKLRSRLNEEKLKTEKYNLVKDIKENYDVKQILSTQVNDYKVYGSIYTLFEINKLNEDYSLQQYKSCNDTILDYILKTEQVEQKSQDLLERYKEQDKDIRLLAYKLMIEKFNKKYSPLSKKQKNLLREFINNVSNTNSLREYVNTEADTIKEILEQQLEKTTSEVTQIKLKETISLLDHVKKGNIVRNHQLKSMLHFYDLVEELEKVNG